MLPSHRPLDATRQAKPSRRRSLSQTRAALIAGSSCTALVLAAGLAAALPAAAQDATPTVQKRRVAPAASRAPAKAPESAQGQTTANSPANASKPPTAGVLPFIPPYFTRFAGGGSLAIDTKGIQLNDANDAVKFRIGGRFQEDFSGASINPKRFGPAIADNGQGRGIDTRRAYFETYLSLKGGIEFAFQYDFNSATAPINDAIVAYTGYKPFIFTIGNFKEPFSLNQLQSDNTTTFTERSLIDTFAPGRSFGGAIGSSGTGASGTAWTATAGVYGGNANLGPDSNGISGTARVTYAPILTDTQVLHFGLAGSYRSLDNNGLTPSFGTKPEDFLFSRSLVSTGALRNSSDVGRIGAEALYQYGPWRVQAEYVHVDVGGRNGQADRDFDGGYVEAGWVINGKGRVYRVAPPYGSEYAVLQGVVLDDNQRISNGGYGVFEVAGRFSAIDLSSRNTTGGTERDFTAGVNWYPDRNIRVMADYVHADTDPSGVKVLNVPQKIDSDIFVGRVNFSW